MPFGSVSSSSSNAQLPMYGTVATTLIKQGSTSQRPSPSSDKSNSVLSSILSSRPTELITIVGASIGSSYALWKVTLFLYRTVNGTKNDDDDVIEEEAETDGLFVVGGDATTTASRRSSTPLVLTYIRRFLRWLLIDEDEIRRRILDEDHDGDDDAADDFHHHHQGLVITHHGSCHCASIQFQILAPRLVKAHDGPGKISYRHAQIKAANFRIYAGHQHLTMYYVFSHTGTAKKGAHGFCSRCGVHILFAPSKASPMLYVNTNCLKDNNNIGKIRLSKKKHSVSNSFAVDGQWNGIGTTFGAGGGGGMFGGSVADNSDQLSTISEVTQPFHFQLHSTQDPFDSRSDRLSPIRAYNNRPPVGTSSRNANRRHSYIPPSSLSSTNGQHRKVAVDVEVVPGEENSDLGSDIPRQLDVTSPPPSKSATQSNDDSGGPFGIIGGHVGGWMGMIMGRGSSSESTPMKVNSTAMHSDAVRHGVGAETDYMSASDPPIEQVRSMAHGSALSNVNTSLSEIGDDLASQDLFSLSADERSTSSSSYRHSQQAVTTDNAIAVARRRMRRKHQSMGGLSSSYPKSVSSPEAQNQMRYFLSRYRESNDNHCGSKGGTDNSHKSTTTETTAASSST